MTKKDRVQIVISIHALREEGDRNMLCDLDHNVIISIHALREEGDLSQLLLSKRLAISIHALREEGDFVNCVMLPDME